MMAFMAFMTSMASYPSWSSWHTGMSYLMSLNPFRKYSTCWVLQNFWEPCKFLKNFVHACVVNVIQGRALPGTVLYIENWIKVKKWRWLMFVSSIDPNLKNWPLLLGLDYSRPTVTPEVFKLRGGFKESIEILGHLGSWASKGHFVFLFSLGGCRITPTLLFLAILNHLSRVAFRLLPWLL